MSFVVQDKNNKEIENKEAVKAPCYKHSFVSSNWAEAKCELCGLSLSAYIRLSNSNWAFSETVAKAKWEE